MVSWTYSIFLQIEHQSNGHIKAWRMEWLMKVTEVPSLLPQPIPWPTTNHLCHFILFRFLSLALNHQPHCSRLSLHLIMHHAALLLTLLSKTRGRGALAKTPGTPAWRSAAKASTWWYMRLLPGLAFHLSAFSMGAFLWLCLPRPKLARAFLFKSPEFWRNKIL